MSHTPRIAAVGTAVPAHEVTQAQAKAFAHEVFAGRRELQRLLGVFDNAGVQTRQLVRPFAWYRSRPGLAEKTRVYRQASLQLAEAAARQALQRADLGTEAVGGIVFVSSTGIVTPSLDTHLIQLLDLPRDVQRIPVWGHGCAGGGSGLARASSLVRATGQPVLLVAVEACSTTFVHGDDRQSNLVATCLFGDGAAAVVLDPSRAHGPAILVEHGELLDDSEHVMGWDVTDQGLQVRFAPTIPRVVRDFVPGVVDRAVAKAGLERSDLAHFVLHPGGPKVLQAYEAGLGELPEQDLSSAREVLNRHGNMSSPSVLFVLDRLLQDRAPSGQPGLVLGVGPGFCAEGVVFRW